MAIPDPLKLLSLRLAQAAGTVWASPLTLAGLLTGLLARMAGEPAGPQLSYGVVEVIPSGRVQLLRR